MSTLCWWLGISSTKITYGLEWESRSLERSTGVKRVRENVKNKKVMDSKENAGKIAIEGKFPCPVTFKGVGINFSRH